MLQVVPAELPTAPITITSTSFAHHHFDVNPTSGVLDASEKVRNQELRFMFLLLHKYSLLCCL